MLTLALMRHAKSSWEEPDQSDFDRPLNERGRGAAPLMGRVMSELKIAPDLILCSSAKRTRETLDLVVPELAHTPRDIKFEKSLYHAMPLGMMEMIRATPTEVTTLLMVGHNPGIHALAISLAGKGDRQLRERLAARYPTAALTVVDFDVKAWSDITTGRGTLRAFITPKQRG